MIAKRINNTRITKKPLLPVHPHVGSQHPYVCPPQGCVIFLPPFVFTILYVIFVFLLLHKQNPYKFSLLPTKNTPIILYII